MNLVPIPRHPRIITVITILLALQGLLELALATLELSEVAEPAPSAAETPSGVGTVCPPARAGAWWRYWIASASLMRSSGASRCGCASTRSSVTQFTAPLNGRCW